MLTLLNASIVVLVICVIVSEGYKARFEKSVESKDERGQLILLKVMSLSYKFLTVGVIAGFFLTAIIEVMHQDYFIFYILLVFLLQSLVSAVYLFNLRKY
jgi:small-conductance mechanosensitive channel